ncbi:MAG: hypothetical protein JKX95_03730 [Bacteroidia bacterium]|nr:hypothetical protein [Bacteroidia bacterium]
MHENKIEGEYWKVKKFIVNDIDSTEYVKYSSVLGYRFAIEDDYRGKLNKFHRIYEVAADGSETSFGHWGRREKNKMFLGVEYKTEETGPFYHDHYYHAFDIISIKKDKMKYKLKLDDDTYEIEFER